MAKFLHWSDMHREMSNAQFPRPTEDCPAGSVDAILLNGDVNAEGRHLEDAVAIEQAWQVPVVMTWGNHEVYLSVVQELREQEAVRLAEIKDEGHQIDVLHSQVKVIGDTRILGATLWTDFNVLGNQEAMMFGAEHMMNDYRRVGWRKEDGSIRTMRAADTLEMHQEQKAWLLAELEKPFEGKTLVMTHHLPLPELLHPLADKSDYAAAYLSDLRDDIAGLKIDAWITGHTHQAKRGTITNDHGDIAFLANMMGYEYQRTNFDPYRVLDMDAPTLGLEPLVVDDPVFVSSKDFRAGSDDFEPS
ncbi:MAG: metallophosphoesterase [Roseibium sp.]|uniref:metallophosphoesterase n=1 Tax=Roseibium sp. TaxID=1936156 RepID=UPI003297D7DE